MDILESSVYVLAKLIMGRLVKGVNLEQEFCALMDFEWLAHTRFKETGRSSGTRKLYRDHIAHPVHVAMLGRWMQEKVPFLHLNETKGTVGQPSDAGAARQEQEGPDGLGGRAATPGCG